MEKKRSRKVNHEQWNNRTKNIKYQLAPLKKEIKELKNKEKDEIKFHLKSIDLKLDSLVVQYTGLCSDYKYIKEEQNEQKETIKSHQTFLDKIAGSVSTIKWSLATLILPICLTLYKVYH